MNCSIALAFYPPLCPKTRAGNPQTTVYMNLQLLNGTASWSPNCWWSLTPPSHPYQSLRMAVFFFYLHLLLPIASTFGSRIPYAARTFLSHTEACQRQSQNTALWVGKVTEKQRKSKDKTIKDINISNIVLCPFTMLLISRHYVTMSVYYVTMSKRSTMSPKIVMQSIW